MANQAILTLLKNKEDLLKIATDRLSPRGCEFVCSDEQVILFREDESGSGRFESFSIRLALYPHTGPRPQYVYACGQITSVRRCAQNRHRVILHFEDMNQEGYSLIAEHLQAAVIQPRPGHSDEHEAGDGDNVEMLRPRSA